MNENINKLSQIIDHKYPHIMIRPHVKSHKCSAIALRQTYAKHVKGVCCAKLCEVEAMLNGGIRDIHLANELVGELKLKRLMIMLNEYNVDNFSICVDNEIPLKMLLNLSMEYQIKIDILVEVNTGQNRCGVDTKEEVLYLVNLIENHQFCQFKGIQGYQGSAQHIRSYNMRQETINGVANKISEIIQFLNDNEINTKDLIVTGGGTGTYEMEASSGVYTEIQPGSYLFMDVDYSLNEYSKDDANFKFSLFVLTTIISRNVKKGYAVCDAGQKSHSIECGMPKVLGQPDVKCVNGGDEHFILHYNDIENLPNIGDKLLLIVNHCDPTVNLHDWIIMFDDQTNLVVDIYSVDGRSPGF